MKTILILAASLFAITPAMASEVGQCVEFVKKNEKVMKIKPNDPLIEPACSCAEDAVQKGRKKKVSMFDKKGTMEMIAGFAVGSCHYNLKKKANKK